METAAREVMDGKLDGQFVVDVFQTGSGTSSNILPNVSFFLFSRMIGPKPICTPASALP